MTATLEANPARCLHCGSNVVHAFASAFCCGGCAGAYELLRSAHLERYYALRTDAGRPVARPEGTDHAWLDRLTAAIAEASPLARIALDIQGLHCTACVWLIERLFERRQGRGSAVVNPTIGRIDLVVDARFDLVAFVNDLESFGYLLGPARKSERRASTDLVWRMGVCVAIAMNSMIFAIAMYAGLRDGPLFVLFQRLNLALSVSSMLVGGTVFFRSAWQGVRRGFLHLDVPIALGIVFAFAGSVYSYALGGSAASYIDTLNVFIALMLVGRWLRERVIERNRLEVLASDGADGLLTRKRVGARVVTAPCTSIRTGDLLVLSPGDLVPVASRLLGDQDQSCSLDWINGESTPRRFARGSTIPAGAFFADAAVVEVEALTEFEESPFVELLRTPVSRDADDAMQTPWWQRVTRVYVGLVLLLAALGGAGWYLTTHDVVRSLGIVTAVLIVTCPCAFGLATPLAYDLAQARLRREGLYVRCPGFLDRAALVRTVVFDKTGTLTSATATPETLDAVRGLPAEARYVLGHLLDRSHHPKAAAIRADLVPPVGAPRRPPTGPVSEWAGLGVEVSVEDACYRLGAARWAARSSGAAVTDLVFSVDGQALAALSCRDTLRPDAATELTALQREGFDVWLLSGDSSARVTEAALRCGLPLERAVGDASPQDKDVWLRAHDHRDVLMVGDGVNDTLVVEHATCSGTPAVDRPFMAARSDFYFLTPGLSPIRAALQAARAVAWVRSMNLTIAAVYNVVAVGLAYAGVMSPLLCAVLMPISSLTTLGATRVALSSGSRLWKSSSCKSS